MLDFVAMHYLNGKLWATIGAVWTAPFTIFAMIEGQQVTLFFAIAAGIAAFLWGCRMRPMDQEIADARKALEENHDLRDRNTKLAEQNERLRIRIANEEESGHYRKPEKPD